MSKGVGGPATMSSFRVQKAFSINFRENKRLRATIRLIEGEHMRSIRQVKQEITETKLWLKGVRENTGYDQKGIPNTERHHMVSPTARKLSLPASVASMDRATPRSPSRGRLSQAEISYNHPAPTADDVPVQNDAPPTFRVTWTDQGPRRPSRDPSNLPPPPSTAGPETGSNVFPGQKSSTRGRTQPPNDRDGIGPPLTAQPDILEEDAKDTEREHPTLYAGTFEKKPRNLSAASRRSNQSLNTFQRRHILESMVVKKQTPLESKKFMHVKDCVRVEKKVDNFLKSFSDWMKIATPDISLIEFDPDKHDTPFAKDVNISD